MVASGVWKLCRFRVKFGSTELATSMNRAMLPKPPHWATSQPPGWSTAARFAKSASWSGTQWKVAVERIASTGSSIGSGCPRSAWT